MQRRPVRSAVQSRSHRVGGVSGTQTPIPSPPGTKAPRTGTPWAPTLPTRTPISLHKSPASGSSSGLLARVEGTSLQVHTTRSRCPPCLGGHGLGPHKVPSVPINTARPVASRLPPARTVSSMVQRALNPQRATRCAFSTSLSGAPYCPSLDLLRQEPDGDNKLTLPSLQGPDLCESEDHLESKVGRAPQHGCPDEAGRDQGGSLTPRDQPRWDLTTQCVCQLHNAPKQDLILGLCGRDKVVGLDVGG